MTNDSIPDYSVSLLDNELYWISGDSIACISNGNVETRCTIVSELNSNVTRIKALKNSDGKKAIVWQQECDSDVNFYMLPFSCPGGGLCAVNISVTRAGNGAATTGFSEPFANCIDLRKLRLVFLPRAAVPSSACYSSYKLIKTHH